MKHETADGTSLRVLCLNDSPQDIERIGDLLTASGYDLRLDSAKGKDEFVSLLHTQGHDVVLSDFKLQELDAFGALQLSIDICPDVPFICVSEPIGEEAATELMKQGAVDYVLKDGMRRLPFAIARALDAAREGKSRRQGEGTLRQSEERYRALFTYSPDALYVHVDSRVTLVNPAFCQLLGADNPSQLIGKSVFEIAHPAYHEKIRERWNLVFDGQAAPPLEEQFVRLDGTVVDVEVRAVAIDWQGSRGVQVIARDITERRRIEDALQKSEELYRTVFENTGTATVLIEENTIIHLANAEFERLSQYSREEIEGKKSWTEFVVQEDLDRMRTQHALRRETGEGALKQYEFRFVARDGNIRDILLTVDIIRGTKRSVASLLDITERKWAQEVVRDSEERFRMVFEHVFDGISIYSEDPDPSRRILVECNEQYAAMAGRTREELLRRGSTDALQKALEDTANSSRLESLAGGKAYRGSFSWIRPDGKENVIEYVGTPITWRGKSYSIGIDRDITEWKRAEEKLAASAREKGMLLKEIYHRVNNNLQVISSLLSLQAGQVKDKRFSELLSESQHRVRVMALVHERLYRSQNLSSIDFGEYLESVTRELARGFGRSGVTLSLEVESIPFQIGLAIPSGLIVNELVTNAYKHAFPGDRQGRVTVSLHRCDDRTVQLRVRDDGVGLPAGLDIRNVSSMGLSLLRDLAEQINGTVVLSEGTGTNISITLPA